MQMKRPYNARQGSKINVNGFTLIEILIVMVIISIVTSVALLKFNRNENKRLASFANELTQTLLLAEEQAMLQPAVIGMSLNENSFQFSTYESREGKSKTWRPLQDSVLRKYEISSDIQVNLEINHQFVSLSDDETIKSPQIIFSINGEVTPFVITISKKGKQTRYKIIGEADGSITQQS